MLAFLSGRGNSFLDEGGGIGIPGATLRKVIRVFRVRVPAARYDAIARLMGLIYVARIVEVAYLEVQMSVVLPRGIVLGISTRTLHGQHRAYLLPSRYDVTGGHRQRVVGKMAVDRVYSPL